MGETCRDEDKQYCHKVEKVFFPHILCFSFQAVKLFSPFSFGSFDKWLYFDIVQSHIANDFIIHIVKSESALIGSFDTNPGFSKRCEIIIPTRFSSSNHISMICSVSKQAQTLVIFEYGCVQIVGVAFWILCENKAKIEN